MLLKNLIAFYRKYLDKNNGKTRIFQLFSNFDDYVRRRGFPVNGIDGKCCEGQKKARISKNNQNHVESQRSIINRASYGTFAAEFQIMCSSKPKRPFLEYPKVANLPFRNGYAHELFLHSNSRLTRIFTILSTKWFEGFNKKKTSSVLTLSPSYVSRCLL